MRIIRSKKAAAAVAAAALVVVTAGTAFAYWSANGSGSGSASTSAGQASAFTIAGNVASAMYPGDLAQTVTATVTNTGTETAHIAVLKAYVTTNKVGCTGADYKLNGSPAPVDAATAADLSVTPVDLAVGGSTNQTFTMQFNNTAADQDACKSAAVTIHYFST